MVTMTVVAMPKTAANCCITHVTHISINWRIRLSKERILNWTMEELKQEIATLKHCRLHAASIYFLIFSYFSWGKELQPSSGL